MQRLVLLQARRRDPGLTLLVALVAAVVIVTAAASLTSRTLSTQMGTTNLGESREAREAAEAGLATVISDLNRQRNRQLLTAPVAMTAWSSPANEAALTNVCSDPSEPTPDPTTLALGQGASREVLGSNGQLQFTLVSMEVSTADRRESFLSESTGALSSSTNYNPRLINPDDPDAFGYLRLKVRGEAKDRSGRVISTTQITRDYKLIPKGCRRSPAPPYGNDKRHSLMRPLIVGFNGGGFTDVSQGSKIGPGLAQAICLIQPLANKCGGSNPATVDGKAVLPMALGAPYDTWLPESQRFPCPGGGTCTSTAPPVDPAGPNTPQHNGQGPTPPSYYIGINPISGQVRYCIINNSVAGAPTGSLPICDQPTVINPFCVPDAPANQNTPRHCRLDRIVLTAGTNLYIDTSGAPIYLYINKSWSSSPPIAIPGAQGSLTTGIIHTYCPSTPTVSEGCLQPAPIPTPDDPPRAMIFTDLVSTLDLSSTETITGIFLWAPNLTLNISNANNAFAFHGAMWVNNLILGPGSSVKFWDDLPMNSATTGTPFPLMGSTVGQPIGPFRDLSYDVVARPCSSKGCGSGMAR